MAPAREVRIRVTLGGRFTPKNMIRVLRDYYAHPEAKSLAADLGPCKESTSGLLPRHTIHVKKIRFIGKEVSRKATYGEDLSQFDEPKEYGGQKRKKVTVNNSEAIQKVKEMIGIRAFACATGIDRRTLRAFVRKDALGENTARRILNELRSYKLNGDRK